MTLTRAIELTEENIETIANSGVISLADAQALYEYYVVYMTVNTPHMFIIDYVDISGEAHDWITLPIEVFEEEYRWTQSKKSGFRYCRLK